MPYYVMQFIQGLGLDDVLEELKKLQLDQRQGRRAGRAASWHVSPTCGASCQPVRRSQRSGNPDQERGVCRECGQVALDGRVSYAARPGSIRRGAADL